MRAQFDAKKTEITRKKKDSRKERYRKPLERIWAPPIPPKGCENLGSAKGPRFHARNKRIAWLIKNKYRLRNHILKGTIRTLIREMKAIGLYSKTTGTIDIEMGFPNLIYCVEQQINDALTLSRKRIGLILTTTEE